MQETQIPLLDTITEGEWVFWLGNAKLVSALQSTLSDMPALLQANPRGWGPPTTIAAHCVLLLQKSQWSKATVPAINPHKEPCLGVSFN